MAKKIHQHGKGEWWERGQRAITGNIFEWKIGYWNSQGKLMFSKLKEQNIPVEDPVKSEDVSWLAIKQNFSSSKLA